MLCLTLVAPVIFNPKTFFFEFILGAKEKFECELRFWGWESWVRRWRRIW